MCYEVELKILDLYKIEKTDPLTINNASQFYSN